VELNETIRDVLKRRVRWSMGLGLAGFVLFMLTPLVGRPGSDGFGLLPLFGFGLFFVAMLSVQWLIRCLKCDSRLGQEMAFRLGLSIFRKPPNFCPYCGVSLDEPRSSAGAAITTPNPLNPIK
jgi:hypothetical protein